MKIRDHVIIVERQSHERIAVENNCRVVVTENIINVKIVAYYSEHSISRPARDRSNAFDLSR